MNIIFVGQNKEDFIWFGIIQKMIFQQEGLDNWMMYL